MEQLYKVLGKGQKSCNNEVNHPKWIKNRWMPKLNGKAPCKKGMYHLCRLKDLPRWLTDESAEIWEAEYRGKVCLIHEDSKVAVQEARITRKVLVLDDRIKRILACDFAETSLKYADRSSRATLECCIYVARCYADGMATDAELSAARSAVSAAGLAAVSVVSAVSAVSAARSAVLAARLVSVSAAYQQMGEIMGRYFEKKERED
jgi:hypothetical protein